MGLDRVGSCGYMDFFGCVWLGCCLVIEVEFVIVLIMMLMIIFDF